MPKHEQQVELLDQFWAELESGPGNQPPSNLDPQLAATSQRLQQLRAADPDPAFISRLQAQVQQAAQQHRPASWWHRLNLAPAFGRLAAAGLVVVIAVTAFALFSGQQNRMQSLSADDIIRQAKASLASDKVQSFAITMTVTLQESATIAPGPDTSHTRAWFAAPNKWRTEFLNTNRKTVLLNDMDVEASDGTNLWTYSAATRSASVSLVATLNNPKGGPRPVEGVAADTYNLFNGIVKCRIATFLSNKEMVAGRKTYKLELGRYNCPASTPVDTTGREIVWLDQETYFLLKDETYNVARQLVRSTEATAVQFNQPLDPALFSFTPLAGVTVQDYRQQGLPNVEQAHSTLTELAKAADFPLFFPNPNPTGFAPDLPERVGLSVRQPYYQVGLDMHGDPVSTTETLAFTIDQLKEQQQTIDYARSKSQRVASITTAEVWLIRAEPDSGFTGTTLIYLRDGTQVSLSSTSLPAERLIEVAASLQPIANSKPLPNPQPSASVAIPANVTPQVKLPPAMPIAPATQIVQPPGITPEQ